MPTKTDRVRPGGYKELPTTDIGITTNGHESPTRETAAPNGHQYNPTESDA